MAREPYLVKWSELQYLTDYQIWVLYIRKINQAKKADASRMLPKNYREHIAFINGAMRRGKGDGITSEQRKAIREYWESQGEIIEDEE